MKAHALLVWLAALVGVAVMAAAGIVAYALLSTPDGPFAEKNSDPRAAKGSDPRISFEQAAGDLMLYLPNTFSQVRYLARNDSRPYFLWFSFVTPCSAVPKFVTDNALVRGRTREEDAIELEQLRKIARDLGHPIHIHKDHMATVWSDEDENDVNDRSVVSVPADGQDCRVVGTFAAYS